MAGNSTEKMFPGTWDKFIAFKISDKWSISFKGSLL